MYHDLRKKSLINIGARVCAYVHVCVCGRGGKGEVFHITHCLVCELEIMKLLHLSESPEVPLASVSYVCLPQQYIAHLQIAPDGAFIKHTRLMSAWTFIQELEQPPKLKFYARVSSRAPFLYLKNKQPNLAFLSDRLTSSSDLASYALSRSSSVQRSFF